MKSPLAEADGDLTKELMMADDFAAEKERDFINAKEARRMLAGRLAEAKYAPKLSIL